MQRQQTFRTLAGIALFGVSSMTALSIMIFGERYPAVQAATTHVTVALIGVAFAAASLSGSWLAWRLRLAKVLGGWASMAVQLITTLMFLSVPIFGLPIAEDWGTWTLCVWALLGSHAWVFMSINTMPSAPFGNA
jgi:hypothetical protein